MGEHIKRITIFRRETSGTDELDDLGQGYDNYFPSVDNSGYVVCDPIVSFDEIIKYNHSEEIVKKSGVYYSSHPVYVISSGKNKALFDSRFFENRFFSINLLTLNKSVELPFADAQVMLHDVTYEINKVVNSYKKKHPGTPIGVDVYACLGSADIVAVINGACLASITDISVDIRCIEMPKRTDGSMLFRFSNSVHVVHRTFNLDNINKNKINALISYTLNGLTNISIVDAFKGIFDEERVSFYYSHGDEDMSVILKDVDSHKLFYLLGVRGSSRPNDFYGIKDHYKNILKFDKVVISKYTRLFNREFETKMSENMSDGFDYSLQIQKLNAMKNNIWDKIPIPAKRTLEVLIDRCSMMLKKEYRHVLGIRMYFLIKSSMKLISNINREKINGEEITKCFGDINSSLNTSLMAGNLNLDHVIVSDVETITPTVKLFYAYESIIGKLFKSLDYTTTPPYKDQENYDPYFFIVVDPYGKINSTNYFIGVHKEGDHAVRSVNFPDISYFVPKFSAHYLAHEIGHYIDTGECESYEGIDVDKEYIMSTRPRNEALDAIVRLGAMKHVWDVMYGQSKKPPLDKKKFESFFKGCLKNELFGKGFDYGLKQINFAEQCVAHIETFCDRLFDNKVYLLDDDLYTSDDIEFYGRFFSALKSLKRSGKTIVRDYRLTIREARADIVMCKVCGFDYKQYYYYIMKLIADNKITSVFYDYRNMIRVLSVIAALGGIYLITKILNELGSPEFINEMNVKMKAVNNNKDEYIYPLRQVMRKNSDIVLVLSDYLKAFAKYIDKKLEISASRTIKERGIKEIVELFRCHDREDNNPAENLWLLYSEWYSAMEFWKKEMKKENLP
jgi:hypothetical protein